MPNETKTFMIEGAQLIWRNFSGEATPFKPAGTRTFSVVLDKPTADAMASDGWNVKCKPPREDGEEELCFIDVQLGYKVRPPKVVVITDSGRTSLGEDRVGILDWAEIQNVDLVCRAYEWEVGDRTGIKAYLQTMYVTIEEDPLERKYGISEGEGI